MKYSLVAIVGLLSIAPAHSAVVISSGTYTQNFNSIASGLPVGWAVYTGATNSTLGTSAAFTTTATNWGTASPSFRNSASTAGLTSGSGATPQAASTNRAISLSLGSSYGNPGGSIAFNFSTLGMEVSSFSFDALVLRPGATAAGWSVQYASGSSPTSWTTAGTYSGTVWGSTSHSFSPLQFGSALDNKADVWIRFVVLSAGTGTPYENGGIDNFSLVATAVPEPTSAIYLGTSFAIAALALRRGMGRQQPTC